MIARHRAQIKQYCNTDTPKKHSRPQDRPKTHETETIWNGFGKWWTLSYLATASNILKEFLIYFGYQGLLRVNTSPERKSI